MRPSKQCCSCRLGGEQKEHDALHTPMLMPLLCSTSFQSVPFLILCCHGFVVASTDHNDLLLLSCEVFPCQVCLQDPSMHENSIMCRSYACCHISECSDLLETGAYGRCKSIYSQNSPQSNGGRAYHGQQLCEIIVFNDTLHVGSSLRVCSVSELINSAHSSAPTPLASSIWWVICTDVTRAIRADRMQAFRVSMHYLSGIVDKCRPDFHPGRPCFAVVLAHTVANVVV